MTANIDSKLDNGEANKRAGVLLHSGFLAWLDARHEFSDADAAVLCAWIDDGEFDRGHYEGERWISDGAMLPFDPQPDLWAEVEVPAVKIARVVAMKEAA